MSTMRDFSPLSILTCCNCGIRFAMPTDYEERRRNDRRSFYCPSGHPQGFYGQTEAERLKAELETAKQNLQWERDYAERTAKRLTAKERQLSAARGVVTRQRNRLKKGQCPCCTQTFTDLRQHMVKEHPHWEPLNAPDVREESAPAEVPKIETDGTLVSQVLSALSAESKDLTAIVAQTGRPYRSVSATLSLLTSSGEAKRVGRGQYVKGITS